ncbi:Ribosomal protein S18 acetylase RimI [Catalinimonas alkaloidigena]|uniref:Ribosomal protein S18 acetylase RimI n=1 Tax=Catalinimonas alkaloidigena TaxID=1075417 RepID=A0A1G9FAT0_9BACT|nr:GNAT family N-acetyltransferase [Catalinimonas alkaloidigena]SDK85438.1 Ribosomal protein S18 acetylase RimI [Catalinimonas alkaloidigena]
MLPHIRLGTPDDAALLAPFSARAFRDTYAAYNTPEDMDAYVATHFTTAQVAQELGYAHAYFLLAFLDDQLAGYVKLRDGERPACVPGQRPLEIARLYVDQTYHGRRYGAALMQASLHEAQRRGHDTLWLGVWTKNERARAFYQRWHFEEVGTQVFVLGQDVQDDLVLARSVLQ